METSKVTIKYEGTKWGIIVGVAFIAYFSIMRALGLIDVVELRFLNYIFLPIGIALALREVTVKIHKHRVNYLPGLGLGLWVTTVASAVFAAFMFIYSNWIDPGFVEFIAPYLPFEDYVNKMMIAMASFGEPFMFGIVFSFVVLQFFKRNRSPRMERVEEAAEKKIFESDIHRPEVQPTEHQQQQR